MKNELVQHPLILPRGNRSLTVAALIGCATWKVRRASFPFLWHIT
jgi:hypothetical protein